MSDPTRLWTAYVEQVAQSQRLAAELEKLRASRSWRVTAPLRWLLERLRPPARLRPALWPPGDPSASPAASNALPDWLPSGLRRSQNPAASLYVEVTQLALEDLGAGVQRVTRRVMHELIASPPQGLRVLPVRLADDGRHYLANRFLESCYGLANGCLGPEAQVTPRAGDAYLGLDFCREHVAALGKALETMRAADVPVALVVHDLLPLNQPSWFPAAVSEDFSVWLGLLARQADVALCISDATRADLLRQLQARRLAWEGAAITVPLGADAVAPFAPLGGSARPAATGWPRLLMVGTIEPRKGHDQVLDALEVLWAEGHEPTLVLAGRLGWQVGELAQRLRRHPRMGRSLQWMEQVDDAGLARLYAESDVLVMASHGEGYGLPVGEAASAGCRLLLRDLPVFREVAGDRARYFDSAQGLVEALRGSQRDGLSRWPSPTPRVWPTWAESASAMAEATLQSRAGIGAQDA